MRRLLTAGLLTLFPACAALANDSTAELRAGGLIFVPNDAIAMRSEDLFISPAEVKVHYVFENTSDKDVTVLVAFPMPELQGQVDFMEAVPSQDPVNFMQFETRVNGKPVAANVEQRVTAQGVDRTQMLQGLDIPLAPHLPATSDALGKLPQDKIDELVRLGMVVAMQFDAGKGMETEIDPLWRLDTTYYWEQTFAAKSTTEVDHRYKPGVGLTVAVTFADKASRNTPEFREYQRKYCMDAAFLNAVDKKVAAAKGNGPMEGRIDYILKTAANWAESIGKFRLVIDKGAPDNLVSFCGEGVKKISPTQFEMRKTDYMPYGDLHILLVGSSFGAQ